MTPFRTADSPTPAATESLKTRNWVLGSVVGGLLLFVQVIMTLVFTNAAARMDTYADGLGRVPNRPIPFCALCH